MEPATHTCDLTRNRISDLLLCRPTMNWATPVRAQSVFLRNSLPFAFLRAVPTLPLLDSHVYSDLPCMCSDTSKSCGTKVLLQTIQSRICIFKILFLNYSLQSNYFAFRICIFKQDFQLTHLDNTIWESHRQYNLGVTGTNLQKNHGSQTWMYIRSTH